MGLGLQTRANLKKSKAFGLLSSIIKAEDIAKSFESCVHGTPLEPIFEKVKLQSSTVGYELRFHPAAEPVYLEFEGEYVIVSAKTSSVGPGYHAFLISCLDTVEHDLGISWLWDEGDEGEYLDETDFHKVRNFSVLQERMREHFQALFRFISERLESSDETNFMISMPLNYGAQSANGEVLTPFGPLSLEQIQQIALLDDASLMTAAKDFFPWWEQGFAGDFYRGLALYSLWMDIRWVAPIDDEERKKIQTVLGWCEKADPPLPDDAVRKLKDIVNSDTSSVFPEESGIGYRRHHFCRDLTGNWQIFVPGSLIETTDDDHSTIVFWNNDFVVRGSTVSATLNDSDDGIEPALDNAIKRVTEFRPSNDGDGFELELVAETIVGSCNKEICILTIWMKDEKLRPLAEQISLSTTHADVSKTA